jgi:deoxyribonuclease V
MILATDVGYQKGRATSAGVLIHAWGDCEPAQVLVAHLDEVAAYVPGQFYKRELPCILTLLEQLERPPAHVVVDGYVHLGRERRPGLGKHLYDALGGRSVVIGVAKSRFRGTPASAAIFRGGSRRPLYVTAAGIDAERARHWIIDMCGDHREPTILRLADQLSKAPESAGPLVA